jgi:hypothetical protein
MTTNGKAPAPTKYVRGGFGLTLEFARAENLEIQKDPFARAVLAAKVLALNRQLRREAAELRQRVEAEALGEQVQMTMAVAEAVRLLEESEAQFGREAVARAGGVKVKMQPGGVRVNVGKPQNGRR